MGKKLFIFTLTALILSMIPAASLTHASAALASYDSATLVLSPDSGPVGTLVHATIQSSYSNRSIGLVIMGKEWGFMGGPGNMIIQGKSLLEGLTDNNGNIDVIFAVPGDALPGEHDVMAIIPRDCADYGGDCPTDIPPLMATATFTVTPQSIQSNVNDSSPPAASEPGSASGQTLPSTGLNAAFLLYLLSFCFVALLVLWHPKAKN